MKKVLTSIIFFVFCFCILGIVYAAELNTPEITGVESTGPNSLTVKYDPKSTNSDYKVLVYNMTSGDLIKQPINTTSYTFTDLEPGKIYNFKVRIYYLENNKPRLSAWSNIVSAYTKTGNVNIESFAVENGQGIIKYSTTGNPAGVYIYVKETGQIYKTTNLSTYTITKLTDGNTYTIAMRTYYTNGATGDWSAPVSNKPETIVPTPTPTPTPNPTGSVTLSKLTTTSKQIVVKYKVTGTIYGVEINVPELGKSYKTTNKTTYTIKNLTNGKKYTIKARPYFSDGTVGVWSSAKSITVKMTNAEKMVDAVDKIAWPKGTSKKKWDAKHYKKANSKPGAKKYFDARGYKSRAKRADCGYFVNTVIYTAIHKKVKALPANSSKAYPKLTSGLKLVSSGKKIKTNILKPGDVIRYRKTSGGQHTLVYYGKINGKHYIAEAGRSSSTNLIRFPIIREAHAGGKTLKWNSSKVKVSSLQVWRVKE